ncbi:glycosyltransferase [Ferruginibacter sp.]|uniref:glycosyltransferase n=1 Tax=Ferruginibacter sp. TaxID=1940288 RepID=UPI00198868FA|nr:glycosyltransferase [Ferruginibacter sp.]MBC7628908.1 glycosyltransferase [Ferruginibacter sp.]
MQKKILFISYDGMTDPLGQSQVIPYLQGLSKNGFQLFILSCEKQAAFLQNENAVKKMLDGYNIKWVPINYTKKPPVLSTLKDIINLKRKAKQIDRLYGIDMVHTRPGIPALVGLWMKQTMGIKFLHDIREFYAQSRVDGGMWNLQHPLYKMVYRYFLEKEKQQVAKCDGIVCLTYAAEKIIKQLPEYKSSVPLAVIPCSADMDLFDPATIPAAQIQQLQHELNIGEKDVIISYLGSIGGWYMTSEMLRFCKRLSDKIPQAKFLFISPHLHDVIAGEAAKHGLPADKLIVKHGTRAQVPALLSLSSYSVFFIKPCYSKLSSSPTKHGEIMAMGIPVITNSGVGDVEEIVNKYHGGYVLNNFTDETFDAAIATILGNKKFDADELRSGATDFYSLKKAVEQYTAIYTEILCKQ